MLEKKKKKKKKKKEKEEEEEEEEEKDKETDLRRCSRSPAGSVCRCVRSLNGNGHTPCCRTSQWPSWGTRCRRQWPTPRLQHQIHTSDPPPAR